MATETPKKKPPTPAKSTKLVKPVKPAKTTKPRNKGSNKRQPKRVWLPVLLDYFGNYILLLLLSGLILWLALIFRGLFDRVTS